MFSHIVSARMVGGKPVINHKRVCITKGCGANIPHLAFFCEDHTEEEFIDYCYLCNTRNVTFDIPPRHYSWTDGVIGSNSARWGAELRVVGGKVCNRCDGEMKAGMERSQQSYRQDTSPYSPLDATLDILGIAFFCITIVVSFIGLWDEMFCMAGMMMIVVFWVCSELRNSTYPPDVIKKERDFHKRWTEHELRKHKSGFYLSSSTKKKFMQPPIDAQNIEDSDNSIESEIVEMIQLLQSSLPDAIKHDKGVKIAGVRLRKSMQVTKITADRLSARVREELRVRW